MNKKENMGYSIPGPANPVFQTGDYGDFFRKMKELLRRNSLTTGSGTITNPLQYIAMDEKNDMAAGLIKTWAVVADVLSFYRERWALEGYMQTAVERKSIVELARAIGYKLKPGLAAQTFLAFTLMELDGLPDEIIIPAGTAAEGISEENITADADAEETAEEDQEPVTFETEENIRARVVWNEMKLHIVMIKKYKDFNPNSPMVELAGIDTGLETGFHLLTFPNKNKQNISYFNTIKEVIPHEPEEDEEDEEYVEDWEDSEDLEDLEDWDDEDDDDYREDEENVEDDEFEGYTEIKLEVAPPLLQNCCSPWYPTPPPPSVFSFQQQCTLFGSDAPEWESVSDLEKLEIRETPIGGLFYYKEEKEKKNQTESKWIFAGKDLIERRIEKLAIDSKGIIYAGTEEGLFRFIKRDETDKSVPDLKGETTLDLKARWEPISTGIVMQDIHALYVNEMDYIFAGTSGGGVYRSTDRGESWSPLQSKLTILEKKNEEYDCSPPADEVEYVMDDNRLPDVVVRVVIDYNYTCRSHPYIFDVSPPEEEGIRKCDIFAGTDNGVYYYDIVNTKWERVPEKNKKYQNREVLLETKVNALLAFYFEEGLINNSPPECDGITNKILAGTDRGMFQMIYPATDTDSEPKFSRNSWRPAHMKGVSKVYAIACQKEKTDLSHVIKPKAIYAGTDNGVFKSEDGGETWINDGKMIDKTVTSLVLYKKAENSNTFLIAGTPDGVFHWDITGNEWEKMDKGLTNYNVNCLAAGTSGHLACSAPFLGINGENWTGFEIKPICSSNNKIIGYKLDLSDADTGIVKSSKNNPSYLVLKQDRKYNKGKPQDPYICLCTVKSVAYVSRSDYSMTEDVTRIVVDLIGCIEKKNENEINLLKKFDLRTTQVFVQSEKQTVYYQLEQDPGNPPIDGNVMKMEGAVPGLKSGQLISITGQPDGVKNEVTFNTLKKESQSPTSKSIHHGPEQPESTTVSKIARIISSEKEDKGQYTTVVFENITYAKGKFKPETVSVCANVAPAGQGETVSDEILGSGDASIANQEFTLERPPLTYRPSDTPSGAEDTLNVWITGGAPYGYLEEIEDETGIDEKKVSWNRKQSLYDSDSVDHDYVVKIDDEQQAHVMFGNGTHGARLPTGVENIIATYRCGLGVQGNMPANTLDMLKDSLPELGEVTNPVAATGGLNPQTQENAEVHAPLSVTALDRIVTLDDYENFTLNFAGISKARVVPLNCNGKKLVHITVAGNNGELEKDSKTIKNLEKAIIKYRQIPVPFKIDSYKEIYFNIDATIIAEPGFKKVPHHQPDPLLERIKKKIEETYNLKIRQFGQGVSASEVITLIQNINGVKALQLKEFYLDGHSKDGLFKKFIEALTARCDKKSGEILVAQLLVCNTKKGGITLKRENA